MNRLCEAARQLARVLESENAALQHMDIPASNALLPAKQAAMAQFAALASDRLLPNAGDDDLMVLSIQLRQLANDNKTLLERAMVAQRHLMALLAKASNQAKGHQGYGSKGLVVGSGCEGAFALSSNA